MVKIFVVVLERLACYYSFWILNIYEGEKYKNSERFLNFSGEQAYFNANLFANAFAITGCWHPLGSTQRGFEAYTYL